LSLPGGETGGYPVVRSVDDPARAHPRRLLVRPYLPVGLDHLPLDGVLLIAGTDGFFELKRSRTREPVFD
jgi:hypothetical protein